MARKTLTAQAVRRLIPPRRAASRKGENGSVLVVGGSYTYHGAPILSSVAALRCGSDLVYTCVPKVNVAPTRAYSPSLIVIPMADQKLTRGAARKLAGAVPAGLDSAAMGMGLAVHERGALLLLVRSLLDRDVRLALDAAALVPDVLPLLSGTNSAVTPHAGEFARLFGAPPPDSGPARIEAVEQKAAEFGITVLLKGPTDVISDGRTTHLCTRGAPAMTAGGTGDVLAGLVAGLLSRSRSALDSAAAAAFVNGTAGAAAQKRLGLHMTSADLLDEIPRAMMPFDRVVR